MSEFCNFASFLDEFLVSVSEVFVKITTYLNFAILENELLSDTKMNPRKKNLLFLFSYEKKVHENLTRRRRRSKIYLSSQPTDEVITPIVIYPRQQIIWMGTLEEFQMKQHNGFTLIELLIVMVIIGIVLLVGGGTLYGWMNSRTVVGYIDKVTPLLEDGGMAVGEGAARMARSSAVSIKLQSGEYFTFSSEDRQWFSLKGEQKTPKCVKAKAFPYAPWFFTKSGTFHDGRLLTMADSCEKL